MADNDSPSLADLASDLAGETDVNEAPVAQEATPEAPSTTETNEPETAEEQEPEGEELEAPADEEPAPEAPSPGEQRREQLNTEIRDLVTQRRDLIQEVERLNAQVYAPQSVDEIMAETGRSELEARMDARDQADALRDYNTHIAETQLVLSSESERVLNDFPMFNPQSPQYKPEVAEQAAQILQNALQYDQNTGQITGSNISPYQLYKTIASAQQAAAVENQVKGQRSAEQMLAAAEPQSSAVPKQPKEDPFLAGLMKGYSTDK